MKTLTDLKHMDKEDVLGMFGLETRQRVPIELWLGTFAAGLLVGAGVALLLAPKSGRELRADLGSRMTKLQDGRMDGLPASS